MKEELFSSNPVFLTCQSHPNQRYFAESLIQVINRSEKVERNAALIFIRDFLSTSEKPLFYSNDLQILLEIIINQLEEDLLTKEGILTLEALEMLVATKEYQNGEGFGKDELISLNEFVQEAEEVNDQQRALMGEIIAVVKQAGNSQ